MVDLTVLGISLQGESRIPFLLLHARSASRILKLRVGPSEALAISAALNAPAGGLEGAIPAPYSEEEEKFFPRFQDLSLALMRVMGGTMLELKLFRPEDQLSGARIYIAANSAVLRLNCRPAEGLALALRCGAPIRAVSSALAKAQDAAEVIASLPEHLRLLALSRMRDSAGEDAGAEQSLTADRQGPSPDPDSGQGRGAWPSFGPPKDRPGRSVPILSGKAPEADPALLKAQGQDAEAEIKAVPSKHLGNVRISLVRQSHTGRLELLDEFCLPVKSAAPSEEHPAEAEEILKNGATEEERWAALLKVLSPETKLPM
ncbi:MAG: bifunctional nuclease family protein [Deltaproteobacteria bacterium]|jgi:bifunctional DNase/RNase|nr:bifunctional nuclease family protein [Deltaproteobacteria bacterium]